MPRPNSIHMLRPNSMVSTMCAKIVERHLATDETDKVTCTRCLRVPAVQKIVLPDLRRRLREAGYAADHTITVGLGEKKPKAAAILTARDAVLKAEKTQK